MNNDVYIPETFDEWKRLHVERHMNGVEESQATWVWDDNALYGCGGGYVCSSCRVINLNMPANKRMDFRRFNGISYCPSCGLKMNLDLVYGCTYEEKEWQKEMPSCLEILDADSGFTDLRGRKSAK